MGNISLNHAHSIHVWYIYLLVHLKPNGPNVGEYTIRGWYGMIMEETVDTLGPPPFQQ